MSPARTAILCVAALALAGGPAPAAARDRGADGSWSERRSTHFLLHQDVAIDQYAGARGTRRFEQDVLDVLEDAYAGVGRALGLRPSQRIHAYVYDAGAFDGRFAGAFRFQAAGFYNGAIHIRGGTRVDARLVRTLHHEYAHAALHAEAGSLAVPAFVDEGVAEWFENQAIGKRYLSVGERAVLSQRAGNGGLLPLRRLLAPGFADVPRQSIGLAYLQSYALVEHLVRRHGERSLREFLEDLFRSRNLQLSLERSYRAELGELERGFVRELL